MAFARWLPMTLPAMPMTGDPEGRRPRDLAIRLAGSPQIAWKTADSVVARTVAVRLGYGYRSAPVAGVTPALTGRWRVSRLADCSSRCHPVPAPEAFL